MSKLIIEFNVKYKDREETKWAWLPSVVVDQQGHMDEKDFNNLLEGKSYAYHTDLEGYTGSKKQAVSYDRLLIDTEKLTGVCV